MLVLTDNLLGIGLPDAVLTNAKRDLVDGLSISDSLPFPAISLEAVDGFTISDSLAFPIRVIAWAEQLELTDEVSQVFLGSAEFLEELELSESLGFGSLLEFIETLTLSDTSFDSIITAVIFSDIIQLSGTLTELPNFAPTFVSALTLSDIVNSSRDLTLVDGIVVSDVFTDILRTITETVESLILSDTLSNVLAIFTSFSDGVELSEAVTVQAAFNILLNDSLLCGMEITLNGEEYVAWVLNPQNKAFTKYTNWPFNSFVSLAQNTYGLSDEGVSILEGNNDAGQNIPFQLSSGLMDFGSPEQSNLRHAYMGVVSGGDLVLKVISTAVGQRTEDYYRLRGMEGSSIFETVQSFSNAVQARFWRFEVENLRGADLQLDGIHWRVVKLRRKVGGKGKG